MIDAIEDYVIKIFLFFSFLFLYGYQCFLSYFSYIPRSLSLTHVNVTCKNQNNEHFKQNYFFSYILRFNQVFEVYVGNKHYECHKLTITEIIFILSMFILYIEFTRITKFVTKKSQIH